MAMTKLFFTNPVKDPIILSNYETNSDTSVKFHGTRSKGYDSSINNSLFNIMENWAAPIPPPRPVEGQLWYNNTTQVLSIFQYNDEIPRELIWNQIGTAVQSDTPPLSKHTGRLWFNTNTQLLNFYNGVEYVPFGIKYLHLLDDNILTGTLTVTGRMQLRHDVNLQSTSTAGSININTSAKMKPGALLTTTNGALVHSIDLNHQSDGILISSDSGVDFIVNSENSTDNEDSKCFTITSGSVGPELTTRLLNVSSNEINIFTPVDMNNNQFSGILNITETGLVPWDQFTLIKNQPPLYVNRNGDIVSGGHLKISYDSSATNNQGISTISNILRFEVPTMQVNVVQNGTYLEFRNQQTPFLKISNSDISFENNVLESIDCHFYSPPSAMVNKQYVNTKTAEAITPLTNPGMPSMIATFSVLQNGHINPIGLQLGRNVSGIAAIGNGHYEIYPTVSFSSTQYCPIITSAVGKSTNVTAMGHTTAPLNRTAVVIGGNVNKVTVYITEVQQHYWYDDHGDDGEDSRDGLVHVNYRKTAVNPDSSQRITVIVYGG